MCKCANSRFLRPFFALQCEPALHFSQLFRDKIEIRQRSGWDWLLVLAGDFE
jgi:hypothetical protein